MQNAHPSGHHEKWDGHGYYGIAGEEIPLAARIVAVADVFDVLTHSRPYKEAWTLEAALDLIKRESGHHFDPQLAACFLEMITSSGLTNLANALLAERDEPLKRASPALRWSAS